MLIPASMSDPAKAGYLIQHIELINFANLTSMRKPLSRSFKDERPRLEEGFIANQNLIFRLARKLINSNVVRNTEQSHAS